jgi:CheY-like chemotaxis protein
MPDARYEKIQALIVDDFDSFRVMLYNMLQELGVPKIDVAATDHEALRLCALNTYDIILCDQNLGEGKTGQQILEELRHTPNSNREAMFVLVSAEANKNMIMAAFDYEPDDYLTKPITAQMLEQRLNRLLVLRTALAPLYTALKENNIAVAIAVCKREISTRDRYRNHCQKILGRLLLESERFAEAERLYRDILDVRQLDWAMLGMATVKKLQGNSLSAQQWLEEIIQFNPLCLKAYDLLADILSERGDYHAQQAVLQKVLELSPLSILRQQAMGDVALKNNDVLSAVGAFRKAVKLGENSCHDSLNVLLNFSRATIQLAKIDKNLARPVMRDALKSVAELPERFGKNSDNRANAYLLEAQLHISSGEEPKSKEIILAATKLIEKNEKFISLSTKIEWVNTLRAQGNHVDADRITGELLKKYASNEDALQKIDSVLEEPCSEKNKALVAKINKEGIGYYDAKNYVRAIDAFNSALQSFPQHIGLRLNLVQALIESIKMEPSNQQTTLMAKHTLHYVEQMITADNLQYRRFRQLYDMFDLLESK